MHISFNFMALLLFIAINFSAQVRQASAMKLTTEEECTTVRLDKQAPISKIKVYDQDGLLMCGAYSTALCVDAERLIADPKTNHLTSPLALGIQYAQSRSLPTLEIGNVLDLASNAKNFNSCAYSTVGDKYNKLTNGEFITSLYKGYQEKSSQSIISCVQNSGIPKEKINNLASISSYMATANFVDFSAKLFDDLCKTDTVPLNTLPALKTKKANSYPNQVEARTAFRNIVNENLKRNRPTGINYCGLVLTNPKVNGVTDAGLLNENVCKVQDESIGHSSNVVGRRLLRYKEGKTMKSVCQYMVRDVYGSSCAKYPEDPTAIPKEVCENGQIWIDEDALFANTAEVFHF